MLDWRQTLIQNFTVNGHTTWFLRDRNSSIEVQKHKVEKLREEKVGKNKKYGCVMKEVNVKIGQENSPIITSK